MRLQRRALSGVTFGAPPPYKKALENRYRVEMHVPSAIFQDQLKEKNQTDNFNSLGAREGERNV